MQISPEVLAVLSNADTDGPRLYLRGHLDRKLYVAVNKVIEANGGKWSRQDQAHIFAGDAGDEIEQALQTGEFRRVKQELGQFDTPPELADQVVELAELDHDVSVLEPSAGEGNLVAAAAKMAPAIIRAIEVDEKRYQCLRVRFDGYKVPVRISRGDFLAEKAAGGGVFDRIVMNPPFARQADIDHVLHAMQFLRRGGLLVSIMSASVSFRANAKTAAFHRLRPRIMDLPDGSFRAAGTMVNACIAVIEK